MAFNIDQLVIFAARSGNLPLLQERLAAGGNVNHIDPCFGSALAAAVRKQNLPVVVAPSARSGPRSGAPGRQRPTCRRACTTTRQESSNASSTLGLASGRSRVHTGRNSSNSV